MSKAKTKVKNPTVTEGFNTMSKALKTEVMGLIEKGLKKVEKGLSTLEKEVHKLKVGDKENKPTVIKSKKAVSNKKVDAIEPASSAKAKTKKGIKKSVKGSKGSKK